MLNRTCAEPGCTNPVGEVVGRGRPRKFCDEHRRVDVRRRYQHVPRVGVSVVCVVCGVEFVAKSARKTLCSEQCRWSARKQRDGVPCFVCGEPTSSLRKDLGESGLAKHKKCFEHGTEYGYNKHGCRCDACREASVEACRAYRERRAAEGRPLTYRRKYFDCVCEQCGAVFESRNSDSRFCLPRCVGDSQSKDGSRGARRRDRERSKFRLAGLKRLADAQRLGPKFKVLVQGNCVVCGDSFAPTWSPDTRTCSTECSDVLRAKRRWISYPDRLSVYERCGWACYLCGKPVDRDLPANDLMAATLDHIVPRADGGADDLVNLALAHRLCNSVKRDLTVEEAQCLLVS